MNAKAALAMALLRGEVVNVKTCFKDFGYTNCAREIGRSIEKPFGVMVSRTNKSGKSRYKVDCWWVDYRLNFTEYNKSGIEKMRQYIKKHWNDNPKTDKEAKQLQQAKLILQ